MADKTLFKVTEKAGTFVAGMRNPGAGQSLKLTEEQAAYALMLGEIERPGTTRPKQRKAAPADPAVEA